MDVEQYIEENFVGREKTLMKKLYEDILYPFLSDVIKLKYELQAVKQELPSRIENANSLDVTKKGMVMVDYYGQWCIPCYQFLPSIEKVAKEFVDEVTFVKIDIDKNPEIAEELGIKSIPLLVLYKDGKEVQRIEGCPRDEKKREDLLRWMIRRAMVSDEEWENTFNIMKKVAEAKGWHFNPNQMVRDGLITALTWNKKVYGNYYCPCKPEHLSENKCPCKPHGEYLGSDGAVERNGICYCGLFVSQEYLDEIIKRNDGGG